LALDVVKLADLIDLILSIIENLTRLLRKPSFSICTPKISAPSQITTGARIDVTWEVKNDGLVDASASAWEDVIYLKPVGSTDLSSLVYLGSYGYANGLEAGKFYERTEQITVPTNLQGQYQVVVVTNASKSLYETVQTDNRLDDSDYLDIRYPLRPDLTVKEIIAPSTVSAGGTLSLSFIVRNDGFAATTTPKWTDRVFLSVNETWDEGDIEIGRFSNASALDKGGAEYLTTTDVPLVIPQYFRSSGYIIVKTDTENEVEEFPQETNNVLFKAINITPLPPADLVTTNVVAPEIAFEGSQIQVRYKVTNHGLGETGRSSWKDTIWLTRDKNRPAAPADILLGTVTHNGSLIENGFYDQETTVTLPTNITGQWYITTWSDSYDVVYEDSLATFPNPDDLNELNANNYRSRAITVLQTAPPDLVVTNVTALPTSAQGGVVRLSG
jgi:large repetitive protein